jgi:aminomethyltransferase
MNEADLKKTPLEAAHRQLHARLVPFAGFLMPVQYSGVVDEHRAVREAAGLFDVSHMGQLRVKGRDALAAVQWLTSNDAGKLSPGQAQYSLLCKPDGTLVDDIIVYRLSAEHFFICVNAANTAKDFQWMKRQAAERGFDVTITDESERYALLALQGPRAQEILQTLTRADLTALKPFHFVEEKIAGMPTLISRTGYTGEDGFEIYIAPEAAEALWTKLLEKGRSKGLKPVGLGARDTLRLEMKFSLYGHEIDEAHTAIEAGLSWAVKPEKGDFIGREALAPEKKNGPKRRLVGFKMLERSVPRQGYKVFRDGREIGEVTSGTHSPTLEVGIGCAFVPAAFAEIGSRIDIDIRGRKFPAEIVKTPFIQRKPVA